MLPEGFSMMEQKRDKKGDRVFEKYKSKRIIDENDKATSSQEGNGKQSRRNKQKTDR